MTFLPIVGRELRVASRKRATWWTRFGVAAIAIIVGMWISLIPDFRRPGMMGPAMFIPLAIFVFLYSLFGGLWMTADSLSEEKREGTLGLLFLTDLKGHDVVLGKLAATSLNICYGLLAIFPVMAIPILAGGVTLGEFLRVIAAALNGLYFSLAAGLLCSALSREERKAAGSAIAIVGSFTLLLPFLGMMFANYYVRHYTTGGGGNREFEVALPFLLPSPGMACFTAFDAIYRSMPSQGSHWYYVSLGVVFVLATTMLALACVIAPRSWQERTVTPQGSAWRTFWDRWRFGGPGRRKKFRARALNTNPFHWLASREVNKPLLVWFFLASIALLWLFFLIDWDALANGDLRFTREYVGSELRVTTALIAHTFLKIWITVESCRRLCTDRRNSALELLLTTPLSVRRIIGGQFLALERQFALPVLAVLVTDILFLLSDWTDKEWVAVWVCGIIVFIADVLTLPIVGMWQALRARDTNRASGAAIMRIMVLPWMAWGMVMILFASIAFTMRNTMPSLPSWVENYFPLAMWFTFSLVANVVFGLPAWIRLNSQFREIATRRFETKRRWFFRSERPPALPS